MHRMGGWVALNKWGEGWFILSFNFYPAEVGSVKPNKFSGGLMFDRDLSYGCLHWVLNK